MHSQYNESGIHPVDINVLVRTLELEHTTKSGIVLATDSQKDREEMSNTTGIVVELADGCSDHPNTLDVKVGENIVFAKFSGLLYLGKDGKKYRVISADNVVATLDVDVKLVDPHLARGV